MLSTATLNAAPPAIVAHPRLAAATRRTQGEESAINQRASQHIADTRGIRPDGSSVFGMTGLGTFADLMLTGEASVVKVDTDLPAEQLALIGCGVTTGVGAALFTAKVKPG